MGLELAEIFDDVETYQLKKADIKNVIVHLPTFQKSINEEEFWLKDLQFGSDWEFDVRIFLNESKVIYEISAFSNAFFRDTRELHFYMKNSLNSKLSDEDGEAYTFN